MLTVLSSFDRQRHNFLQLKEIKLVNTGRKTPKRSLWAILRTRMVPIRQDWVLTRTSKLKNVSNLFEDATTVTCEIPSHAERRKKKQFYSWHEIRHVFHSHIYLWLDKWYLQCSFYNFLKFDAKLWTGKPVLDALTQSCLCTWKLYHLGDCKQSENNAVLWNKTFKEDATRNKKFLIRPL